MNDDDQGDDRGKNDNTGRAYKPEQAQNRENAPTGHLGTGRIATPNLGGSPHPRQVQRTSDQTQGEQSPDRQDNRPLAAKTGDKEVDAHYGKDHRLVTDRERRDMASKGQESERAQGPYKGGMSAQDIFNKMARDRAQERDRGR